MEVVERGRATGLGDGVGACAGMGMGAEWEWTVGLGWSSPLSDRDPLREDLGSGFGGVTLSCPLPFSIFPDPFRSKIDPFISFFSAVRDIDLSSSAT